MRLLIFIVFLLPFVSISQTADTIYFKDGRVIPCTIINVTGIAIKYSTVTDGNISTSIIDITHVESWHKESGYIQTVSTSYILSDSLLDDHTRLLLQNKALIQIIKNNHDAGFHLQKASYMWYAGVAGTLLGSALCGLGAAYNSNMIQGYKYAGTYCYIAGGAIMVAGLGCMINIPIQWNKAGLKLQQ